MVACLREAVAIRREEIKRHRWLQSGDPIPEFNVLYGTDSKSCADEMEMHWESGTLLTIAKSKISPLAETYLHSRRELHDLNATFTLIKLPGHGGVYPMAAADACAKACHRLPERSIELIVHSTLAIPVALPANPQTLATGATPDTWRRLAGTPSPHAASSAHLQFAHARLQEATAIDQLQRYIASHDGAPYLAIDKAAAGLSPPEGCRRTRWAALLAEFNRGRWVYGAEDGTSNSATVALAVTGGGTLVPGVRVCTCGYEGKVDGRHWLQECRDGPSAEVRACAAKMLRSVAEDVLDAADSINQATLGAIDKAATQLCERPGHDPDTPGDQLEPPDPASAVE